MISCILVIVHYIQTRFAVEGLNFLYCAILLMRSPLILARMIYLIVLSVIFKNLFFPPIPFDGYF